MVNPRYVLIDDLTETLRNKVSVQQREYIENFCCTRMTVHHKSSITQSLM